MHFVQKFRLVVSRTLAGALDLDREKTAVAQLADDVAAAGEGETNGAVIDLERADIHPRPPGDIRMQRQRLETCAQYVAFIRGWHSLAQPTPLALLTVNTRVVCCDFLKILK